MKRELNLVPVKGINELGEDYSAIQILSSLQKRYPDQLKPEIVSIRMYQTDNACFLEVTEKTLELKADNFADTDSVRRKSQIDYRTERTDLGFICGDEFMRFFDPEVPVQFNAKLLLNDFDDNSMLNCTNIIRESAIQDILDNPDQNRDAYEQENLMDDNSRQL
jgi:hypothetical protein